MSERSVREHLDALIAELRQDYGELRVQANLAKMEGRDELEMIGAKLEQLEAKSNELGGATVEASRNIGAAAKLLGEEIRDGLKRIAKRF
jgi:BMFP domain-containing protein YqiC